ncbi:hypothetical protein CRX72_21510 [Pantoea sp. BRM17]|nr:hypothetical protein CRX72_21510 [Pantoea sp. BRM17]
MVNLIAKEAPLLNQVLILAGIAILVTIGVYGIVAMIVKIDDLGYWLREKSSSLAQAVGGFLLAMAPWLMKILTYEGVEKVLHSLQHDKEEKSPEARQQRLDSLAQQDPRAYEKSKVKGAVRTDFILSAEIVAITLGIVSVLGDDLSLNAQQVTGVKANRELPVVWGVAKGSFLNKLILVPLALVISAFAPWLITPLLMLGGAYLWR